MSTRRAGIAVIVLAFAVTTACGGDDDSVGSGAGPSLTAALDGDDERCEALRALAEAQPPAGSFEPDEFDELEAALHDYADAAERAAEASEGADRQLLTDFAELVRAMGSDPGADVVDEVDRLADPMWDLAVRARQQCDVSLGLLPG